MSEFIRSSALLLVLLNPFLVSIYIIDLVEKLDSKHFTQVLIQGGIISTIVFWCFAFLGDAIFSDIFQANFASFQIFGGLVFLLIGLQFVFRGPTGVDILRSEHSFLAGSIAMPVLIGPGSISASVIIGKRHDPLVACLAILIAMFISIVIMILLKKLHDYVRPRREPLVERYIVITGRITALYVGTVAVDMIMKGLGAWIKTIT